jgi:small-conductance mechanosensitive channel
MSFRIAILHLFFCSLTATARPADFSGDWQTFWRTGSAVLTLEQEGDRVTGTYQPDDGRIEGRVENGVLRGAWEQPGSSGKFLFALSEDGQVITGRFGNGEYWNGFREDSKGGSASWQLDNDTPRVVLRSLLLAANAAIYDGDAGALRQLDNLVTYAGDPTSAGDEASRRQLMFNLLDMCTLRIMDVPEAPGTQEEDTVRFAVGPAAVPDKTTLEFEPSPAGGWRLVLPEEAVLAAERDRFLESMGHETLAELDRARADSPRAVLREFVLGARTWDLGGRDRALAVMDLSEIPERLHDLEGPIYADFVRRIIDRVAYVIWQEVPDDPDRSVPYVYFQHPVGNITIARVARPAVEGVPSGDRWMISAETLTTAPALLEAMQDLPMIGGLEDPEPLSPYFHLRERVRSASPGLVAQWGYLEIWQWLGFGATLLAAVLAAWLIAAIMRGVSRPDGKLEALATLAFPTGLLAAAAIVNWAVSRLGVTQAGIPFVGSLTGVFLVIAVAVFAYRLATVVGGWFHANASKTTSYADEIATSLATGFTKLLIVVGAIIAIADVAGLPYEGVLTGLGVGGVAIAFAARDTVSNMMGGGLLIADRPFQRGDLIELDGKLATVEEVGLRSTRLRALDDTLLHVPNVQLSDRIIANWGKRRRRKVSMLIGLTYDTPRERLDGFVKRLREVVLAQPKVDPDDVYVGLKDFGASSIDIGLICHLRVFDYGAQVEAKHALVMEIIALAEEVGVEFAFPTRTLHLAGNAEPPHPLATEPDPAPRPST